MRQTSPADETIPANGIREELAVEGSTKVAMTGLSLAVLMPSLATSSVNTALPALTDTFDAPFQIVQWVIIAYMLVITSMIVAVGRAGDIIGRERLMVVGIATFTAASLLCGLASDLPVLIAARCVQGLGAAAMMTLSVSLIGELFPDKRSGRAMGLLGTMSAIGTTMGPSLGGILIANFGWQAVFLGNVPFGLIALALLWRGLPMARRSIAPREGAFDVLGMILLAITLAACSLVMTTGEGQFSMANIGLLIAALTTGAIFVFVENRAALPLVDLALFRDRGLRAGFIANAVVSTVMMATLVVGPFYLLKGLQLDAASAGIALSFGPFVAAIAGLPAGRLIDRVGPTRAIHAGQLMMTAGSLALALATLETGIAGYLLPIAMLTAGYATFQAANNTAIMATASSSKRGVISGLLNLSRNLGLMAGASAMGAVFLAGVAGGVSTALPEAIAVGMRNTFIVATALIAIACVIGLENSRGEESQW